MTKNLIPAEIILTALEGKVYAHVNGERIAVVKDGGRIVRNIDEALRAAGIYRQTGYVVEAGAMIAEGQRVVAA